MAAPVLINLSPFDDQAAVGLTASYTFSFDQVIARGNGKFQLKFATNNVLVTEYTVSTSSYFSLDATQTKLVFTPPAGLLTNNTKYLLVFDNASVRNAGGEYWGGISDYNITTINVAPAIVAASPMDDTSGVGAASNLVFVFNQEIRAGNGNILLKKDGATVESFAVKTSSRLTFSESILTIDPTVNLVAGGSYSVEFPSGAIVDYYQAVGNAAVSNFNFTVAGDAVAPTVLGYSPADGATGIAESADIVVIFSETIARGTGSITLKTAGGTTVETFNAASSSQLSLLGGVLVVNPTSNLSPATEYVLEIANGAIKDSAGNSYAGGSSFNFTVAGVAAPDTTAPTVNTFNPTSGATGVALNADIVVTFSEAIQRGTGSIVLKTAAGATVETYDAATSGNLSLSGATLTINPTANLSSSTAYKLEFAAGTLKDSAGNAYAGTTAYSFTSGTTVIDTTAPTASTFSPVSGATGVAVDANVVVTFSEAIQKGTGTIVLKTAAGATVESYDAATSGNLTVSGSALTINPTASLFTGTQYKVEFAAGSIKDTAGNSYAGTTSYSFTTTGAADTTPPTVTITASPASVQNSESAAVTFTFSEAITGFDASDIEVVASSAKGAVAGSMSGFSATPNPLVYTAIYTAPASGNGSSNQIKVNAGEFADLVGNGSTAASTLSVSLVSSANPEIVAFSPLSGATDVAVGSNIVVTFSEAIQKGTGNIVLKTAAGATIETFDAATSSALTFSGDTLTINPTSSLASSTAFKIEFAAGSVKDTAGNSYAGSTTYGFTTAAPADTTAPTVSTFSPASGASDVAVDANVVVSFSETVQKGTGNIVLKTAAGVTVETYDAATSGNLSFSGNTLTINPSGDLALGTQYKVEFAAGSVKDSAGNSYAGTTSYSFTTVPDTFAPTATTFSPASGATDVALAADIAVAFSEAIQKGTGNIVLKTAAGATVETYDAATSGNLTFSGSTLTINPTVNLAAGTQYKVEFAAGTVKDLAGNPYAGTTAYSFTTVAADTSAPTVTTFNPASGATDASLAGDIVVTFSEAIQKGTGSIVLKTAAGATIETYDAATSGNLTFSGSTLTINPTANLTAGTQYKVEFAAGTVEDLAGNDYAGTTAYSFSTGAADTTAPTVTTFSPTSGATDVAVASDIVVTFSEVVQKGTGNIVLKTAAGVTVETYDAATSANLTLSGSTLTINPTANLGTGTQYKLEFAAGSIKDAAGNAYAGTTSYSFTTVAADTTAPTASAFSPASGATGVAVGSDIVVTFSESIQKGTGNIVLKTAAGATVATYDAATSGNLTVSGNTLTINPTADLTAGTEYKVEFAAGTIKDAAGNAYAGTTGYGFTTQAAADTTAPTVAIAAGSSSVQNGATTGLTFTFSEAITGFDATDVTVSVTSGKTAGAISALAATSNPLVYTAVYTAPATNSGTSTDLKINAAKFADAAGNQNAAASNTVTLSLVANANPTVVSFSPASGATGVVVGSNIVLTFSETIQKGTGNIVLKTAAGATVATYDAATSGNLTVSGNTLTINPTADLSAGTEYKVEFAAGSIKDSTGNAYAGTTAYGFTTAVPADTTAPTPTMFSPSGGSSGVALGANIVVTFNEAIQKGTGTIVLKTVAGATIETYDVATSGNVTVSGSTLTINPTADLSNGTNYRVEFAAGSVKDLAGNAYAGTTGYTFTTVADTTAPTVSTFSPAGGATGVSAGSDIVVTFSEAIQKGTGNIVLKTAAGVTVATYDAATSGNLTVSGNTLTLNPTANLAAGTQYKVEFASGSVKDLAGNAYAGTTNYSFTTHEPYGTAQNDRITAGAGDEVIDGLAGRDTVVYAGNAVNYQLAFSPAVTVNDTVGGGGLDALENVERLEFADRLIALDVGADGNANAAARMVGAIYGAGASSRGDYASLLGTSLQLLDQGHTYENAALAMIKAAGLTRVDNVLSAVFTNTSGLTASQAGMTEADLVAALRANVYEPLGKSIGAVVKAAGNWAGPDFPALIEQYMNGKTSFDYALPGFAGTVGNDVLAVSGAATFDGLDGRDLAFFAANKGDYTIVKSTNSLAVTDAVAGRGGVTTLTNFERLSFADKSVAFDADGNAGKIAKVIGTVMGATVASTADYARLMGIGLETLDAASAGQVDSTLEDIAELALAAVGAGAPEAAIALMFQNVAGVPATQADIDFLLGFLNDPAQMNGDLGKLAVFASNYESIMQNAMIETVGVRTTGIDYIIPIE